MDQGFRFPIPAIRLIIRNHDRILILKRANTQYARNEWCLPGGKVDYGATVEQTIHDELFEETALRCTGFRFLFYQDSLPATPGAMHCINFYFECTVAGEIELNGESAAYAWMAPGELGRYALAFRNDEAVARYLAQQAAGREASPNGTEHH